MASEPACALRRAVAADATCLGALAGHVFLDTYATAGIDARLAREAAATGSIEAFAERLADPAAELMVAEIGPYTVGYADVLHGGDAPSPAARGPEVRRLYVHPRHKRRGIGRALLASAERAARARDATSIWLTAWVGNTEALAFYAALGWRDVGTTLHVFEGVGHENRILVKALA